MCFTERRVKPLALIKVYSSDKELHLRDLISILLIKYKDVMKNL